MYLYCLYLYLALVQVNMKDYAQYKNTFVKAKQSKAISNAIEEIEKYCKGTSGSHEVDNDNRNDGDYDVDDDDIDIDDDDDNYNYDLCSPRPGRVYPAPLGDN